MGRHQAPDAPGRDPALAPSPVPDPRPSPGPSGEVPTERIGAGRAPAPRLIDALTPIARPVPPAGTAPPPPRPTPAPTTPAGPAGPASGSAAPVNGPGAGPVAPVNGRDAGPAGLVGGPGGADPEATTVLRRDELAAFLQAGAQPAGGPPVGATRSDLVNGGPPVGAPRGDVICGGSMVGPGPVGGPAVGATRADLAGTWDQPAPYQETYNTGTFSRVLLTGLGGSAEPGFEPAPLPAGPGAKDRAVATTRRLAARVAALRGDERTALLAVGAVVGIVLLMLAILVVVVRLAGGSDASPAAAPPPSAAASPTPAATPEPTGSPLPPSGGSFTSRHSNLCLGVPQGRTDSGAQLVQRTCGTDFGTGFLLVAKDQPGAYELVSSGTSLCADVLGASMDDGAPVAQWDCNGGANQTFQLRPLTDATGTDTGYVQIVAAHSGKCLDVTNASADENAPVQQATCRDPVAEIDPAAGNQSWRFTAS